MHRFFVFEPDKISKNGVKIVSDGLVHQMFNVLRFKEGEQVTILDGFGSEYLVELTLVSKKEVVGRVLERIKNDGVESTLRVVLYQSILKNLDKFELVLQKGTEIGVSEFVPLITQRTERQNLGKIERLNRIMQEAAEQSGRGVIPVLGGVVKFMDVLKMGSLKNGLVKSSNWSLGSELKNKSKSESAGFELNIIADPDSKISIKELFGPNGLDLKELEKINIFIGPEGGFTEDEVKAAVECGFMAVSVGKTILRSETAGIVVPALVLYCLKFL